MDTNKRFLLGVSVDDLSHKQAIDTILQLIDQYKIDKKSRYVTAVNMNNIVNSNCWNWPHVYNNELLSQLRKTAVTICDDGLLRCISYLLGSPFKEKITGTSFLNPLAASLVEKGYSVFLLGGTEAENQATKESLQYTFKELKIAGTATPQIAISGIALEDVPEKDNLLLEQINNASPDVLLINLGHPKQELWFTRNSSRLQVPVSIGVGNAFSRISSIGPNNSSNKKYLSGLPQALYMAIPAIIYQQFCNGLYYLFYRFLQPRMETLQTRLYVSSTRTIAVLELPTKLNLTYSQLTSDKIEQVFAHDHIVVDFRYVKQVTLEGISFLVGLWMRAQKAEKELSGLALTGDIRLLFKVHRAWDILSAHQHHTVKDLVTTLQQARYNTLYHTIYQEMKTVHISFFGQLNNNQDYERLYTRFEPILKERYCKIDFTYCTTIEELGFAFLLRLKKYVQQQGFALHICCLSCDVENDFKHANLVQEFPRTPCRPYSPNRDV